MQTLIERLEIYCTANGKEMPYGKFASALGGVVANAIKEAGKYELVQKREETQQMIVNDYPDDLLPIIDEAINIFFTDRQAFWQKAQVSVAAKKAMKFFNYDVVDYKAPAFEAALMKCNLPVMKNFVQKGKAQYKVPVANAAALITLGKEFQRQRFFQEKRERMEKYQTRQRQTEPK